MSGAHKVDCLVSVVIPARNAAATLSACIEACLAQTLEPAEIIVVDDGSTDATPEIAARYPVKCLRQEGRGPAAARNRGAFGAAGSVLVFTDADCVSPSDWISRMVAGFEDGVGAVGGGYTTANPGRLLPRMVQEEITLRHERYGDRVDFLGSYNLAVRREAFEAAGGFDERFTAASAEDNDLSYRLREAGWELRHLPDAPVGHHHPERLLPYLRTQARHGFWRVLLYRRHAGRAVRGDRYASLPDLAAPALAWALLLLVLAAPGLLWADILMIWIFVFCIIPVATVYIAIRLPLAARMALRARDIRFFEFGDIAFMRDLARGWGMLRGVVWFILLRRETA
jgi:glycosyltransferase involved in cell wall biosynthesis